MGLIAASNAERMSIIDTYIGPEQLASDAKWDDAMDGLAKEIGRAIGKTPTSSHVGTAVKPPSVRPPTPSAPSIKSSKASLVNGTSKTKTATASTAIAPTANGDTTPKSFDNVSVAQLHTKIEMLEGKVQKMEETIESLIQTIQNRGRSKSWFRSR